MISINNLSYKNLIIHATFSASLTFIATLLNLPVRFLEGLHTYIHPENIGNEKPQGNVRAAIRRPEHSEKGSGGRSSKDKFEFNESNAQIFRLRLVDSHLRSRLYFADYRDAFIYSFVALLNLVLHAFLPVPEDSNVFSSGAAIPILLGFFSICKLLVLLAKMSFEKSASKRSEKQLGVLFGVLGFLLVLLIVFVLSPSIIGFEFDSSNGFVKLVIAFCMGCLAGFLFVPATKIARAFWIGTDQLRWNLSMISCGKFGRMLLYTSYLMLLLSALLWINPVADVFFNRINVDGSKSNRREGFKDNGKLRVWCLLASTFCQLLALRPNLQMYLNEAVLSWYQRLHASKVPDFDFSRAKIFLHNYYLCLVVLQLFAPPTLVLLFLGLSQIRGNLVSDFPVVHAFLHCFSFVKEAALFMAWWVAFVSAILTSLSLAFYRCGVLFIS